MIVLGIETSCDETAAAVVTDRRQVLADLVLSQVAEHRPYGGIVPEIAARAHLDHLDALVGRAVAEAGVSLKELDGIAATAGPGLIGGLLVGVTMGKAIAVVEGLPFVAVNHLEGHALSARLSDEVTFPYLLLLVSGGHCQLLIAEGVGRYRRLGTTIDDAVGEAFDKAAMMLGLGYPGGAEVERAATEGDAARFALPRPLKGAPGSERCANAAAEYRDRHADGDTLVVAGGVAANRYLRGRLEVLCRDEGLRLVAPPPRLCTDNGAMIAWAGIERLRLGLTDGPGSSASGSG
jgi:N6-L-threonylcarbamoyladenine synthase